MAREERGSGREKYVDPAPRWYTPLKWLLPISMALGVALITTTAILGILPIPMMFGKLAWLPAVYASQEGLKAAAMITVLPTLLASFVGLSTSMLVRSTILFSVNERRAYQGDKAQLEVANLEKDLHDVTLRFTNCEQQRLFLESQLESQLEIGTQAGQHPRKGAPLTLSPNAALLGSPTSSSSSSYEDQQLAQRSPKPDPALSDQLRPTAQARRHRKH